ncbi:MAG: 50S ribosomal protein L5 [Phycisphaerales bacterium]|nr:50S ribosomal protein L5 [Phycisphaerales bacterium]
MTATAAPTRIKTALQEKFEKEVLPKVKEKFGITNPMALPRLEKVVINTGMGKQLENNKLKPEIRDAVLGTLAAVSGQKPVLLTAKKSVANFKVREGATSAAMVTLRRDRMWSLLQRVIHLAIPRVKDFRGLKDTSFDKQGNYSFGFSEQAVFPEIDMGKVTFSHGMHINISFRNSNPAISRFVLAELGWPFKREDS